MANYFAKNKINNLKKLSVKRVLFTKYVCMYSISLIESKILCVIAVRIHRSFGL